MRCFVCGVGVYEQLRVLSLSFNAIETVPPDLGKCRNLRVCESRFQNVLAVLVLLSLNSTSSDRSVGILMLIRPHP